MLKKSHPARWRLLLAVALLCMVCPVFGAGLKTLRGHVPGAVARFHLKSVGTLPANNVLRLAIGLPLRNEAALDALLNEMYDPASPNFHHYLTPEEFTEHFGPTEQDYQAVVNFAKQNHLTVTGTSDSRLVLDVSGAVPDIERAFQMTLRTYRHPTENREFFAPDVEPSVDAGLPVADVSGLDNYSRPHPKIHKISPSNVRANATPKSGSGSGGAYLGNDFRTAYATGTTLTGAGQIVGLFQFDGFYQSDITAYETASGRTNIPVQAVLIDGVSGTPGYSGISGANDEVSLDIEMAIAMAPGLAKVLVFEGTVQNDILNSMAASNTVKQFSCSWGWGGGPKTTTDSIFKKLATQGQSFFNASGDSDAFTTGSSSSNGVDNTSQENAPSSCPYITQVGGTTLTMAGAGAAYSSETVWNWGGGQGSSGGISSYYSIPTWQTNINMTIRGGSTTFRNIPDVALTADNVYVAYDNGSTGNFGGTSCAAPLWAGFMALVNQQATANGNASAGFINPAIYAIAAGPSYASCFHDTTAGNNFSSSSPSLFYATNGFDLCTGLGTPAGQNLINALAGSPDVLSITPLMGLAASGAIHGPFGGASQNFTLTNSGATSVNWSIINTSAWMNVSPAGGVLGGGKLTNVTASLNASATNLAVGGYTNSLWFTNQTTHIAQLRQFTLQVVSPLAVLPGSGFSSGGPLGGPFSVTAQNFTVTNLGAASLAWGVVNTSSWLNVSSAGGALAAAGKTNLTISLTSAASGLSAGTYAANVLFTNLSGTAELTFALQSGLPLIENGGFETGDFTDWTLTGNTTYNLVSTTSGFVHSGSYGALLGQSGSLGYLSQNVPTTAGENYLLSLWLDNPTNASGATPNQFMVQWNGTILFNATNLPFTAWTNLQFVVSATNASSALQLGFRNDPYYLGLDDINVTTLPLPAFQTTVKSASSFKLAWNTVSGLAYQVEYKTNLVQTDWLNLGKPLIATNNSLTVLDTNAISSSPQRFYRLQIAQ